MKSAPVGEFVTDENFLNNIFRDINLINHFVGSRLSKFSGSVMIVGKNESKDRFKHIYYEVKRRGIPVRIIQTSQLDSEDLTGTDLVLICTVPTSEAEWRSYGELRRRDKQKFVGIWDLVAEYSVLDWLYDATKFYVTPQHMMSYYAGDGHLSHAKTIDQVANAFPLRGKSVIEFGFLDGCQSLSILSHEPSRLTAIEIRPENAIKLIVAQHIKKIDNLEIKIANFHGVNATECGRYDLAYAHGVYYHSSYPFLFFENLISLSDNILLGGWAATDVLPDRPMELLAYESKEYRVKKYIEPERPTAGVQPVSYHFYTDDVIKFFDTKGYGARVLLRNNTENKPNAPNGEFFRILFQKQQV